jgi:hypothetical protein
MNMDDIDET